MGGDGVGQSRRACRPSTEPAPLGASKRPKPSPTRPSDFQGGAKQKFVALSQTLPPLTLPIHDTRIRHPIE